MANLWAFFGLGPTELIVLAIPCLGSVSLLTALAIIFIVLRKKRDSEDD